MNGNWAGGMTLRTGADLMVKWLNANNAILPHHDIEVIWQDTSCSTVLAEETIYQNWYDHTYFPYQEPVRHNIAAVALLGPACNDPAIQLARNAYYFRMPAVSNFASSPELTNRQLFPGFWRTVMPDTYFSEGWLSIIRVLGLSEVGVVLGGRERTWVAMVPGLLEAAALLNVTLVGPALPSLGASMQGWDFLEPTMGPATLVAQNVMAAGPRPPRFLILLMDQEHARMLLCAMHKEGVFGIVPMTVGWYNGVWWRFEEADAPCTNQEMDAAVNMTIMAVADQRRDDVNQSLTCSPAYTAGQFFEAYDKMTRPEIRAEGSSTADAVCMLGMMLHKLLYEHNLTVAELEERSPRTFELAQQALEDTDFEGVQGRIMFRKGTPDPQQIMLMEQMQIVQGWQETGKDPKVMFANYFNGTFTWTGRPVLLPNGKRATARDFLQGRVTEGTAMDFIYPQGRLDEFVRCGSGEVRNMRDNTCRGCGPGQHLDPTSGDCDCRKGFFKVQGRCLPAVAILVMIVAPGIFLIGLIVVLICLHMRAQADAVWKVRIEELTFKHPVEVLGRGSFGLVLKAEYRGTMVAVKRTVPPFEARVKGKDALADTFDASGILAAQPDLESGLASVANGMTLGKTAPYSQSRTSWRFTTTQTPWTPVGWRTGGTPPGQGRSSSLHHYVLRRDFVREMRLLSKLRHPCVTTVMGAVLSSRYGPMLVMELMDHGSLYDLLHNGTLVVEGELVLPILRDVAQGMRFLHAALPVVVHGDLKAANVLVDAKFRAKVADFGLSQKRKLGACGTPLWMAPELLNGAPNSMASDVYAFAILLSEVYTREDPYFGENIADVLEAVADPERDKRPKVPEEVITPEMAVLMHDCWHADAGLRPTFAEVDRRLKSLNACSANPKSDKVSTFQASRVQQHQRAKELLYDVFPRHVADALREGRKVDPENHEVVTIFFSDIVGFTDISSTLSAQKVSDMLDRLYVKFDQLSREHNVFKVETIGDAYMAVANLVEDQSTDHAKRVALFAVGAVRAAQETMVDEDNPDRGCVNIRVGFHSGAVVANVVGTRNLRYCLFGDTVNTASRMESTSERNRIQCSAAAAHYLLLQAPEVQLRARGPINIKGKGKMETFWVHEGPPSEDDDGPSKPEGGERESLDLNLNHSLEAFEYGSL